jgi:hypothetical protein
MLTDHSSRTGSFNPVAFPCTIRVFSLQGIPLLVLGNKNDLPGALSTTDLIDRLDLKVSPSDRCLQDTDFWAHEACSA